MIVRTKSFNLAVYQRGDEDSPQLALVLPGKLDTKDYEHMRSHVDTLSMQGFLALSFDPPGTWDSGDDIFQYTMTNYLKAINELIEHFGNRETVLIGHSRGGSMAMLGAVRNPHVKSFVAIMSQAGPSRLEENRVVDDVVVSHRDIPGKPNESKRFDLPLNYYKDADSYDLHRELSSCTKKKLFIYGTRDDVVAPELVRQAFNGSAEPKQILALESDHDYRHHPELIEKVNKILVDFFTDTTQQ